MQDDFPKLIEFHFSEFGECTSVHKVVSSQRQLEQCCELYRPANSDRRRFINYIEVDWRSMSFQNFPLSIHDFLILVKGSM